MIPEFEKEDDSFKKDNFRSIEFAEKIETYLKYWGLPSLIYIINSMSIFLDLPHQFKQMNSVLAIVNKGSGKSTLLEILSKSNPRLFQLLPKKMFESQLVMKSMDYYNNKVLIHDDIIVAFGGLARKQREQLVGFFTLMLSDQNYSREGVDHLKGAKCLAFFGIATESYAKYKAELLESTFLDRFCAFQLKFTREQRIEILRHRERLKRDNIPFPTIRLPLEDTSTLKMVLIDLSDGLKDERNALAMQLDDYGIMSSNRAQNYIDILLRSNALLNDRTNVTENDLIMYKKLHKYHLEACGDLNKEAIVKHIHQLSKNHQPTKETLDAYNLSIATYYRIRKRLEVNKLL